MRTNAAFTLLEISIAFAVIGLLIGGILVGRSVLEAGAIRAQIAQLDQFNIAVTTFQTKYGALPGDISAAQAAKLNLATRTGAAGHGDGDGFLPDSSHQLFGETALFWNDLGISQLIPGAYPLDIDGPIQIPTGQASRYLPDAKIGGQNSVLVFANLLNAPLQYPLGVSFRFAIGVIPSTDVNGDFTFTIKNGMTPTQAAAVDTKIDDGTPLTGIVWGTGLADYALNSFGSLTCDNGTSYLTSGSNANKPMCVLMVSYR